MPSKLRSRNRLLNLLAVLIGLGGIAGLEVVLQIFDIGPSSRLFLPSQQQGEPTFVINPQAAHRFFQPQYLRHVPFDAQFSATKSPGTIRIFVLGASTLVGFPNPPTTAFPHFIEGMLSDVIPDTRFEVINCGITAINTFCLLDFAEEIASYQPDLLLLYTGHNEFVGPYGATTPFIDLGDNRTLVRGLMYMQRLRLYGLLRDLKRQVQEYTGGVEKDGHFGLHLATRQIDILDEGYRLTGENFRRNLVEIIEAAAAVQMPVMLSSLVSNIKDFYPLRSACGDVEFIFQVGGNARLPTEQGLKMALAQAPYCAALHFELGQLHLLRGESSQAHQAFLRARDMDRLPFRAPTFFNQIIRQMAATSKQVILSDTEKVFAAESPQGIIGRELITEHLHPTVYGHFLIARTMVEAMLADTLSTNWGMHVLDRMKTYEEYAVQVGYTLEQEVDRRNSLMLFLKQMPYEQPPLVLQRHLAALVRQQLHDISRLKPVSVAAFRAKGGDRFLRKILNFVPLAERQLLHQEVNRVLPLI